MKAGREAAAGGLPIAEMKRWYLAGDSNQTSGNGSACTRARCGGC